MKDDGRSRNELSPSTRNAFELAKKIHDREPDTVTIREGLQPTFQPGFFLRFTTFNPPSGDGNSLATDVTIAHRIQLGILDPDVASQTPSIFEKSRMLETLLEVVVDKEGVVRTYKDGAVLEQDELEEVEVETIPGIVEHKISDEAEDARHDKLTALLLEIEAEQDLGIDIMSDQRVHSVIKVFSQMMSGELKDKDASGEAETEQAMPVTADTLKELRDFIDDHAQETISISSITSDNRSYELRTTTDSKGEPLHIDLNSSMEGEWIGETGTRFNDKENWGFYSGTKPAEYETYQHGEYDFPKCGPEGMRMINAHNREARQNREEKRRNGENMATPEEIGKGLRVVEDVLNII